MAEHEYRLKSLADDELLAALANIVRCRNQITAEFLAYLAELDERQLFLDLSNPDPAKLALEPEPNSNSNSNSNSKRRRHCPAEVARAVFLRDDNQCSDVSPDGRRCNARRCLELPVT